MKKLTRLEAQKLALVLENAEICERSLAENADFRLKFPDDETLIEVRMSSEQKSRLKALKQQYLSSVSEFYHSIADEVQGVETKEGE